MPAVRSGAARVGLHRRQIRLAQRVSSAARAASRSLAAGRRARRSALRHGSGASTSTSISPGAAAGVPGGRQWRVPRMATGTTRQVGARGGGKGADVEAQQPDLGR